MQSKMGTRNTSQESEGGWHNTDHITTVLISLQKHGFYHHMLNTPKVWTWSLTFYLTIIYSLNYNNKVSRHSVTAYSNHCFCYVMEQSQSLCKLTKLDYHEGDPLEPPKKTKKMVGQVAKI